MYMLIKYYHTFSVLFGFSFKMFIFIGFRERGKGRGSEKEREKHWFALPLTYAFIGCMYPDGIEPTTLVYTDTLTHWAAWLGLIFFQITFSVSLNVFPEVESLGCKSDPFLIFCGSFILLSTVAAPISIPTNSTQCSLFFTSLLTLVVCCIIDDSHSFNYSCLSILFHINFRFTA